MASIAAWIISHGWRQLLGAGIMLALFLFVLGWNYHERGIGEKECSAAQDKVNASAQGVADKAAAPANAQLHKEIDAIAKPLPGYLEIYGDKSRKSDCPDVPYVRKLGVRS